MDRSLESQGVDGVLGERSGGGNQGKPWALGQEDQ